MDRTEDDRRRRFDVLFTSYSSDIVAYCRWRTHSPSDAQDAAAEVFLTAWRRLDELPRGDSARVWLYATARRVLANQRRANRRRSALHDRMALEPVVSAEEQPEEHALVYQALDTLPARDREILLLTEWEGLSPTEIATVVGCLTVTVRGRLHRARRRFRSVFEELQACESRRVPTQSMTRRRVRHEHV
jgi:RNA polymerase sigma-70 factor (ECF subfamily)